MSQLSTIRNFSIIAHIDHGKTTLTDRFLEITKTVDRRLMHGRFLDSHPISQERGVTIKLAPVRMNYGLGANNYRLNLIDTPGHIDFSYEVSRSLACCEGAVLLVDAGQGIQAQTLAHWQLARKLDLRIIPVINKIDLQTARLEETAEDLIKSFGFQRQEIVFVSAKTGENVEMILKEIVEKIPPPAGQVQNPLRALVFDSFYHPHKGVIAYLRVVDGQLKLGSDETENVFKFLGSGRQFKPLEAGYLVPQMKKAEVLAAGEVGYLATGLKDISLCQVGDTVTNLKSTKKQKLEVEPLPGYQEPKPVVFFDFYPVDNNDFDLLEEAVEQLKLNDVALSFKSVGSPALGKGLRMGFLGVFHALITQERLERDFNLDMVITSPSVEYLVVKKNGQAEKIQNASQLPDTSELKEIKEPWIKVSIFSPLKFLGGVFRLLEQTRAKFLGQKHYGSHVNLQFKMPLIELIKGFYDQLKSVSSGFASLNYRVIGFEAFDAARLDVFINREKIDALSLIIDKEEGRRRAGRIARKLKEVVPPQLFEVPIQIALNGRVISRETIRAQRKDVTAKLYGGDQTRKDKLLKKQKKGKKRLKEVGKITLPQEAFLSVLGR